MKIGFLLSLFEPLHLDLKCLSIIDWTVYLQYEVRISPSCSTVPNRVLSAPSRSQVVRGHEQKLESTSRIPSTRWCHQKNGPKIWIPKSSSKFLGEIFIFLEVWSGKKKLFHLLSLLKPSNLEPLQSKVWGTILSHLLLITDVTLLSS